MILDWDGFEKILHYILYTDLRVEPSEHPLVFTDPTLNPTANREKLVEICFDTFNAQAVMLLDKGVLPLISVGKTTGVVVSIGYTSTEIVPVEEGFPITHAIRTFDVGGSDITDYLRRLLRQSGYSLDTSTEREIVRDIKEKLCYAALDYEKELKSEKAKIEISYTLPDGEKITIRTERFTAPECLFNPSVLGIEGKNLSELIVDAVQSCDTSIRNELYENIVLCGGTAPLSGLKERLQKELSAILPETTKINIITPEAPSYAEWIAASIIASRKSSNRLWITKKEYEERGPDIIREKLGMFVIGEASEEELGEKLGKPIVIDMGAELTKAGYAGEDQPRSVFPTIIGYPKYESIMTDVEHYTREYYVGEEALNLKGVLKITEVVGKGLGETLEGLDAGIEEEEDMFVKEEKEIERLRTELKPEVPKPAEKKARKKETLPPETGAAAPAEEFLDKLTRADKGLEDERVPLTEEGYLTHALERKASLIFWERMCLEKEFDLIVSLHKKEVKVEAPLGTTVEEFETVYKIPREGNVRIIPVCGACNISPAYREVKVKELDKETRAEFKVMPLKVGTYDLTVEFQWVRQDGTVEPLGKEKTKVTIQEKP
ncbi:MAG: hypothetical protein Q6362_004945, partial [Candidatus Wukongarchaeota archaeon]|nr:hypothetical protein [Candidatus Wukongarchaeota archaeon]